LLLYISSLSDFKFFVTSCKNEEKKNKTKRIWNVNKYDSWKSRKWLYYMYFVNLNFNENSKNKIPSHIWNYFKIIVILRSCLFDYMSVLIIIWYFEKEKNPWSCWFTFTYVCSAWNGRSPSRQMRLISYSGDQKLLQIR